jgi:hypothetical protein
LSDCVYLLHGDWHKILMKLMVDSICIRIYKKLKCIGIGILEMKNEHCTMGMGNQSINNVACVR